MPNGLPLASLVAVGAASLVFAGSLWSALRLSPLPSAVPSGAAPTIDGLALDARRDTADVVALTSDPFNADRSLPDDGVSNEASPSVGRPATPAGELTLLGTVVRGSGSFALCQLPSDAPRIVHIGEQLGDMTLISLDQGRAVFRTRSGTRVELSLSKPVT
jgi:hypothetical protein